MSSEIQVAKELLKINAIKLSPDEPFTWASGLKSPIYCDNRMSLSFPLLRDMIKVAISEQASHQWSYNLIAGVATAGIAHGALVADHEHLPFIYVRSSAKKHGTHNIIEGHYNKGDKCLVIEDLISTGGSSLDAVHVLRRAGIEVVGVAAIFSYHLDISQENFAKAKCPYFTLSNYSALLSAANELGYLSPDQLKSLSEWRNNPQKWSDDSI